MLAVKLKMSATDWISSGSTHIISKSSHVGHTLQLNVEKLSAAGSNSDKMRTNFTHELDDCL